MKKQLETGMEYPIKGEDTYIFQIARDLTKQLQKLYGPGESERQAHPKMHGVLKGEFTVLPDLRQDLQVGVFKEQKTYPCWIRVSSSNTKTQPDIKKDVRGFSIKLFEVFGEKLITSEEYSRSQDFLLVSMPEFPIANVHQFQKLLSIIASGKLGKLLLPQHWGSLMAAMRLKKTFVKPSNLLQIPYWSAVPYQFGDIDRAVKYHIQPRSNVVDPMPKKPADSFLRETMIDTLSDSDIYYDFMVQFQEDPKKMPIENAQVKWKSEFTKVATLKIPMQQFADETNDIYGQGLEFSPWHSLPAHRPLGGLNRARRIIYHSMAEYRRKRNGAVKVKIKDHSVSK